jgi:hypothetical protein
MSIWSDLVSIETADLGTATPDYIEIVGAEDKNREKMYRDLSLMHR